MGLEGDSNILNSHSKIPLPLSLQKKKSSRPQLFTSCLDLYLDICLVLRLTNSRQSNICPVISLQDMHACTYITPPPPNASSFALLPLNINNLPCDNHMYWINYLVIYPSQTVFKMTCKHRRYINCIYKCQMYHQILPFI